jgi:ankyrin repeat protein
MSWSQDVVISVLFPYFLPSFPVCKDECWSKEKIRCILEELLVFYCCIPLKKIQELLETFVRRVLSISSCKINLDRDLDRDLHFLADIENRCSFIKFDSWESSVYSLYAYTFLVEHKVDIQGTNHALHLASRHGYKNIVALLLEHKADINTNYWDGFIWASYYGHIDTVALLLEHKADVNARNECALRFASANGHKDTVALLLKHKADIHVFNDQPLQCASESGDKDTVTLLLEHKADIHAFYDCALRQASYRGHKDIVALLLEQKADVHAWNDYALREAIYCGHKDTVALLLEHKAEMRELAPPSLLFGHS